MKIVRPVRATNTSTIDTNFASVSRLANKKHNGPHTMDHTPWTTHNFLTEYDNKGLIDCSEYIADVHLQAQVAISN